MQGSTEGASGSQSAGGRPRRVLFLCTHNRARSQLAEGICRKLGEGAVEVWSAGSERAVIHPCAVRTLAAMGIDASGQRSKHMDELRDQVFDYVITVCDQVREICPVFPGDPSQIHWSIQDPSAVVGSDEAQMKAFEQVARQITDRIRALLNRIAREQRGAPP